MDPIFTNKDLCTVIFSFLNPYDRAAICSVCSLFANESLRVSMLLASHDKILLKLYDYTKLNMPSRPRVDAYLGVSISKQLCIAIARDPHLYFRLKYVPRYMTFGLGATGDTKLINMMLPVIKNAFSYSSDKTQGLLCGLAYGGHHELFDTYCRGAKTESYLLYQAAKGGQIQTIDYLIKCQHNHTGYIIYGGCKSNNKEVISIVPKPWCNNSINMAFIGAAKGGHMELLENTIMMHPDHVFDHHTTREAWKGADKRRYTDICQYISKQFSFDDPRTWV